MLTDIENAIVARVSSKVSLATARVQAKGEGPVARYPSFYCATMSAQTRRIGNNLKVEPLVYLIMKFKSLGKEEDRRKGVYPIVEGVMSALFNQNLGLKIDALTPTRFQDITDDTDRQEGFIVLGMELKTGFVVNTLDDSDEQARNDLITIGLKYYLEPDINSDGAADAEDDLTTQ